MKLIISVRSKLKIYIYTHTIKSYGLSKWRTDQDNDEGIVGLHEL